MKKKRVLLKPRTQICAYLITKQIVTNLVDPVNPLYTNVMCSVSTGAASVEPNRSFRILDSSYSDHPVDLIPQKVVTSASMNHENLKRYDIKHEKMLDLIPEYRNFKFRNRQMDVSDIDTIN